jgi:hypothetical protein
VREINEELDKDHDSDLDGTNSNDRDGEYVVNIDNRNCNKWYT